MEKGQTEVGVQVKTIPGGLPPFWDRSVLFFANIHSIFYENVDETRELIKEISGARSYGGRLLPVLDLLFLGRKNLLLLEDPPDKSLMAYLSGTLGLSLPRCEVIHHADYAKLRLELQRKSPRELAPLLQTLKEHPADWIDGFVTDTALAKIASLLGKRTICSVEGSKNGNNKYLLHRYQMEKRLPTFDTLIASNRDELSTCLESLRRTGYKRVVIKAQIGASGYGMIKQETDAPQLEMVPDYLFFEGPCMVQGWIDQDMSGTKRIGSPSVQMFLDDHTLYLFDLTEQILSEQSVHEGNMSWPLYLESDPAIKDDLLRQAAVAGEWLHRQHYRGTASTDFLVVERGGGQNPSFVKSTRG